MSKRERERDLKEVPPELRWIIRRFTKLDEIIDFYTGRFKRQIELLEEIRNRLPPAIPTLKIPELPPISLLTMTREGLKKLIIEAGEGFGTLRLANDYFVEVVSLTNARDPPKEFTKLKGIALTIFKTDGDFDLYFDHKDDAHKIPITSLTYPQTFLIDWFKFRKVYIGNSAQSGLSATLIAWKRVLKRKRKS